MKKGEVLSEVSTSSKGIVHLCFYVEDLIAELDKKTLVKFIKLKKVVYLK